MIARLSTVDDRKGMLAVVIWLEQIEDGFLTLWHQFTEVVLQAGCRNQCWNHESALLISFVDCCGPERRPPCSCWLLSLCRVITRVVVSSSSTSNYISSCTVLACQCCYWTLSTAAQWSAILHYSLFFCNYVFPYDTSRTVNPIP